MALFSGPLGGFVTAKVKGFAPGPSSLEGAEIQWERGDLDRPATDEACIHVRPDGRQLVIQRGTDPEAAEGAAETGSCGGGATGGGEKQKIVGFSERSRRNLRRTVHSLWRDEAALFLSMTWHEDLPTPERAKAALDRFGKRLRRHFPGAAFLWKMEPQERGFPHFHILVYGLNWIDAQWVSEQWHECTSETTEQHRKSGVDVEWVRSDGKLQSYLAEYFAETYDEWPEIEDGHPEDVVSAWAEPGRFWGIIARENLPVAEWAQWRKYVHHADATSLICDLLDEWGIDLDGVIPPSLTINTRGDPMDRLDALLDRL
jgi:hypothetical protein